MRFSIPLISSLLLLSACGKSEPPAPAPVPTPEQAAPAPAPEPMPAATPATAETAPAPMATESAKPSSGSHVVVSGDTLYEIAKAQGVKASDLMKWNNISDPRRLKLGQELKLSEPAK